MKIALILRPNDVSPPPKYGGCGRVVAHLAKGLMERNHDVTVYTAKPSTLECEVVQPAGIIKEKYEQDIGIDRWAGYTAKVFDHILERKIGGQSFDIINNHYDPIAMIMGRAMRKSIDTPMLTTIHGTASDQISKSYIAYPDECYSAISFSQRTQYPDNMNFIGVVHNAIDENHPFSNTKRDYLFSMSRIHPVKGQEEAIAIAEKTGLDLIIAGNNADKYYFTKNILPRISLDLSTPDRSIERRRFIDSIKDYQSSSNEAEVTYVGEVTEQDRDQIMQYAKALIFPIKWNEPFGLVIIEAGIVGTPVIASNMGAVSEIIEYGKTGFHGESLDELVELVEKVDEINPVDCREHILSKFGVNTLVKGYLDIYERVLIQDNKKSFLYAV